MVVVCFHVFLCYVAGLLCDVVWLGGCVLVRVCACLCVSFRYYDVFVCVCLMDCVMLIGCLNMLVVFVCVCVCCV